MKYEYLLHACTKLEIPYSSVCCGGSSGCNGSFVIRVVEAQKVKHLIFYPIHVRATIK